MGPGDVSSRETVSPIVAPPSVQFSRGDCEIFERYPQKVPWKPENVPPADQAVFKDIRNRLKQLAGWLADAAHVGIPLRPFASLYEQMGRSQTDLWCCVYPDGAPNKSYTLQVALIVSAGGAEVCLCLGAGESSLRGVKLAAAEQSLQQLRVRLASVPSTVVQALERAVAGNYSYRKSWRQPAGTDDFAALADWLAYAASPGGARASISRNFDVEELERLGSGVGSVLLDLAEAAGPLLEHCFSGEPTPPVPESSGTDAAARVRSAFDADSLERLATDGPHRLEIDRPVYRAIAAAILSGKHVILTGPPGTAKTTLAELTCQLAREARLCSGYTLTTATADWTTYETIGGLRPAESGTALEFREGLFLEAARWLIVDELNRSNFDRAFGQLFTVLSGQSVVLPYEEAKRGRRLVLAPEGTEAGYNAEQYAVLRICKSWRIVATMNVFDKSLLFEMSFALMRRFAFIEVASPSEAAFARVWGRELSGLPDEPIAAIGGLLTALLELRAVKDIGPAVFIDMARFSRRYIERGPAPSGQELAFQLFYSYLLPQFEGISNPLGQVLFKKVGRLVGDQYRERLRTTLTDVLGLVLPSTQPQAENEEVYSGVQTDIGEDGYSPPDTG
jgi:MoxR-like ATPase